MAIDNWTTGELPDDVREFLAQICADRGCEPTPELMIEELREGGQEVWVGDEDDRRWWRTMTIVSQYKDKFISYPSAYANRDMSVQDLGWMMDLSAVRFVEPHAEVVTITVYK